MNNACLVIFHLLLASAFSEHAGPCMGCPKEADTNSQKIRDILTSGLHQTNSEFNLVNIKKCTQQLVAGTRYTCEVEITTPTTNGVQSCVVDLITQPWISKNPQIISETCSQLNRNKREVCAGCPVEHNASDDNTKALLSSVLSQTNSGLTLVKGTKCTTQVVSGIRYRCEIEVSSPTTNGVNSCVVDFVSQPWISKNPQIISETCSQLKQKQIPMGGVVVVDPSEPAVNSLLSSALSQTNSGLTLVKGTHCTSQIVSGTRYMCDIEVKSSSSNDVKSCVIEFLTQPWISSNPQIISETCSTLRNKREVCAGCPVEHDASDENTKQLLSSVLSQTNSGFTLVKGTKCTSQVVAGIRYRCEIEVSSPTTNGVKSCVVDFVSQPWISKNPQIISETCSQLRNKREVCAGCPVEHDASDEDTKQLLSSALSQTNSGLTLVKGTKCTTQVVSGVLYKCVVEVTSPTVNQVKTCQLSFLLQPWISQNPQIVSEDCTSLNNRFFVGVPTEVDPSKGEVKMLLDSALSQTNSEFTLVKGTKCTSQVVSGILYKCEIQIQSPTIIGVQHCHISFVSRPWISVNPQVVSEDCSAIN